MAMRGLVGAVAACGVPALAEYPDPERFRGAVDAFLAAEANAPPPKRAVVATGSSSMRGWHRRIAADLAPLPIIRRGFGGSTMADVRHFLEPLVLRHEPRAVLLYEGDNDIAFGVAPAEVVAQLDAIVAAVHERLPATRIHVLAVKPSVARWHLWARMRATNALLRARAEANPLVHYIDVATPMLGDDGRPRRQLFVRDMLHLSQAGYDLWRDIVRPPLLAAETVAGGPEAHAAAPAPAPPAAK